MNTITIKFDTELKPTQNNCKSQLYNNKQTPMVELRSPKFYGNFTVKLLKSLLWGQNDNEEHNEDNRSE